MSSGFISETEIAEARRIRQEEWDKVRSEDQPEEAPEEVYDHRSLFERLEEQKQKRDNDYEEAHKLKNMIKGLDDDEVDFLDFVDRTKLQVERQQNLEEARELQDYRNQVATLQEKSLDQRLQAEIGSKKPKIGIATNRVSQKKILAGVVIKKRKLSDTDIETPNETTKKTPVPVGDSVLEQNKVIDEDVTVSTATADNGSMKCIGILPGLGIYSGFSDSEDSTDSHSSDSDCSCHNMKSVYDLAGRKVLMKSVVIAKESANN